MNDDHPFQIRGGGVVWPAAPWPLPIDRRAIREESDFAPLPEPVARGLRAQEATLRNEQRRQQHTRMIEALRRAQEAS